MFNVATFLPSIPVSSVSQVWLPMHSEQNGKKHLSQCLLNKVVQDTSELLHKNLEGVLEGTIGLSSLPSSIRSSDESDPIYSRLTSSLCLK